jgi:hypothetical protein
LALKTDRRLATIVAQLCAIGGPLYFYNLRPDFVGFDVILWNIIMRVIVFQLVVMLFDRIGQQSVLRRRQTASANPTPIGSIAGNWPVILFSIFWFALVMLIDILTSPQMLLMPFYMAPCIVLTLALNWRWGTLAATLAAICGPLIQREDPGYQPLGVQFWNTVMRLILYLLVVGLLERIRRENILFTGPKRN